MGGCFVKAAVRGQEEKSTVETRKAFLRREGEEPALLSNAELLEGGELRTHRPLVGAGFSALPGNIRAVRAHGDCMLLLNLDPSSGFFEVFSLKNGVLSKTGTSLSVHHYTSDGSDYCNSMVATEDEDAAIDQGCTHTKLLFFPSKQVLCLGSDGTPSFYTMMPTDVPSFRHATVAKGRLYGSVGQKLYVSGEQGCFDWYFDESGTEQSASSAWLGNSMTVSEGGLPITALVSYKDGVLVFRENAMQMIKGDVAPFVVKDLFKTGTANSKSVKEAEGLLYFISENRVACYNGTTLSFLPSLPEGTVLPGCAGVLDGKYCFYAERDGSKYIYTYHPDLEGYSVLKIAKKVREFVTCGKKLYLLMGEAGEANPLYVFSEKRGSVYMMADLPLNIGDLGDFALDRVAVHAQMKGDCSIDLLAELTDKNGKVTNYNIGSFYEEKDAERIYRMKSKLPWACGAKLQVRCMGDALLKGYRVQYRKRDGTIDE